MITPQVGYTPSHITVDSEAHNSYILAPFSLQEDKPTNTMQQVQPKHRCTTCKLNLSPFSQVHWLMCNTQDHLTVSKMGYKKLMVMHTIGSLLFTQSLGCFLDYHPMENIATLLCLQLSRVTLQHSKSYSKMLSQKSSSFSL